MINRNPWPRGAMLAILFVGTVALSHRVMAQQVEQTTPPATPPTQTAPPQTQPATPQTQPTTPPAQPATPQAQPPAQPTQSKPAGDSGAAQNQPASASKPPKDDRIFFALPNLLTVENASSLPRLTTGQKFKTVAEGCFDPVEVVFIGIQAGIDQADNADPTYHQGFSGYSKRFGTDYTDAIIGNFGTGAIFPTLLHQDPRYCQMGKGNFFRRFMYAAIRVVITRSESSGKHEFNFSEFLGNGMAAGLSNLYHPGPHTIASTADVEGTQIVLDTAGYELKEFWPDIRRFLVRGKHKT
ncbi:MAG: hypothetical protein WAO35_19070 [Terriglobia bacterium]